MRQNNSVTITVTEHQKNILIALLKTERMKLHEGLDKRKAKLNDGNFGGRMYNGISDLIRGYETRLREIDDILYQLSGRST